MTPLAIVTMVYDDEVYLDIWLRYWEKQVPRGNLYVLIHDNYEFYADMAQGCNVIRIARPKMHPDFERDRWRMISDICSGLTYMFKRVIYTDVDEIIALDPQAGDDLPAFLLGHKSRTLSPFGVEVVHKAEFEPGDYDRGRPVLDQRHYIAAHGMYSKPCIVDSPINWGSGGHFCDQEDIAFSNDLILFHLRLFDEAIYRKRSKGRRDMIRDPKTNKPMVNLGGPSWRDKQDELDNFTVRDHTPMEAVIDRVVRRKWKNSGQWDAERGVWKRQGILKRELGRIPTRFEGLF